MSSFGGNQTMDVYGGQFTSRNDVASMQVNVRNPGQMRGIGGMLGPVSNRSNSDWYCQSCGRLHFAGRDQCNPCGVSVWGHRNHNFSSVFIFVYPFVFSSASSGSWLSL